MARQEQLHEHHDNRVKRLQAELQLAESEKTDNLACLQSLRSAIEQFVEMKGTDNSSFCSSNKNLEGKVQEAKGEAEQAELLLLAQGLALLK